MGKCKGCKWWNRSPESTKRRSDWGECSLWLDYPTSSLMYPFIFVETEDEDLLKDFDVYMGVLTSPFFSCTMFESKEE